MEIEEEDDVDFDILVQNALLYGVGVMIVQMDAKTQFSTRVIPIEEYAQLGDHLKYVEQNRVDKK